MPDPRSAPESDDRLDLLQGTLDLLVLRTLEALGPMHGYGIAQRIEQVSGEALYLNQGTLYPALLRLQQRGLISSAWGTSENNRRAKFYSLTAAGSRQLEVEKRNWRRMASLIERVLATEEA
jgi:transcriptional regulator